MTNHPNRSQNIETIRVTRMYDANYRPSGIWHIAENRICSDEEKRAVITGGLRMVETRTIPGHPSYGRSDPDGNNWPSTSRAGADYTLSPNNVREFLCDPR